MAGPLVGSPASDCSPFVPTSLTTVVKHLVLNSAAVARVKLQRLYF
jgi:hypothetical protein